METYGFFRLECTDLKDDSQKKSLCENLVNAYEINNCRSDGQNCDIYITNYRIGGVTPDFKQTVKKNIKRYQENCSSNKSSTCKKSYTYNCYCKTTNTYDSDEDVSKNKNTYCTSETKFKSATISDKKYEYCSNLADENVFSSGFQDYIVSLPDYVSTSSSLAKYRVIVVIHHTKDYNNYISYSTIEVNK